MTDKLKALALAAPAGPWEYDPNSDSYSGSISNKSGFLIEGEFYGGSSVAAYIAAASPDAILALIAKHDHEKYLADRFLEEFEKARGEIDALTNNLRNATNILQGHINGNTSTFLAQTAVNTLNAFLDERTHHD